MTHGGKREGAGRPPLLENKLAREIVSLSAHNIVKALSEESTLKPIEKAELSKHYILKSMPYFIESDGSFAPKTVVIMRNDKSLSENRIENAPATS